MDGPTGTMKKEVVELNTDKSSLSSHHKANRQPFIIIITSSPNTFRP
jgi:hypothetical protein